MLLGGVQTWVHPDKQYSGCWDDEKMLDMEMLSAIKDDTGYVLLCSQEL